VLVVPRVRVDGVAIQNPDLLPGLGASHFFRTRRPLDILGRCGLAGKFHVEIARVALEAEATLEGKNIKPAVLAFEEVDRRALSRVDF